MYVVQYPVYIQARCFLLARQRGGRARYPSLPATPSAAGPQKVRARRHPRVVHVDVSAHSPHAWVRGGSSAGTLLHRDQLVASPPHMCAAAVHTCLGQGTMLQTEPSKQLEYNLGVLKRRDAAITRILDMAGHVVLYKFNEDTKQWDRKNVEGSLFVVERSTDPLHQFVVLNRLSSENLVESINEDFQTELNDQFLLYRNLNAEILGVWFYSAPERAAVAKLLDSLTGGQQAAAPGEDEATAAPGNAEAEPSAPADMATQRGSDAAAAAPPPSNVAEFFSMMAGVQEAPPPMPTSAVVAGDAVTAAAPSAPDPAADARGAAVLADTSAAPPQSAAAPASAASDTARPPIDMEALKAKLALQLRALVDDNSFLTMLANEYLRQQQRAIQQVGTPCLSTWRHPSANACQALVNACQALANACQALANACQALANACQALANAAKLSPLHAKLCPCVTVRARGCPRPSVRYLRRCIVVPYLLLVRGQAQQQRQNRLGRGAPQPPTAASAAPPSVAPSAAEGAVAAHLSGLLQQQASM